MVREKKERNPPPQKKAFSFFLPSYLPRLFFPFAFVPTLLLNLNLSIPKNKINSYTRAAHTKTVANKFDELSFYDDVPSEVSFIVFASVWTMVVTIYLLVASLKFPKLAPVIVVLALNAVTMLFWFAAFIALAVWKSNHFRKCHVRFCDTIVAGIVFGAFEW